VRLAVQSALGPRRSAIAGTRKIRIRNVSTSNPSATVKPTWNRLSSSVASSVQYVPARTSPALVMTPPVCSRGDQEEEREQRFRRVERLHARRRFDRLPHRCDVADHALGRVVGGRDRRDLRGLILEYGLIGLDVWYVIWGSCPHARFWRVITRITSGTRRFSQIASPSRPIWSRSGGALPKRGQYGSKPRWATEGCRRRRHPSWSPTRRRRRRRPGSRRSSPAGATPSRRASRPRR